ncbi:hypothetical protein Hsc_3461 [Herbaspirillum seropedicae]|nr:hypothetical protein Hsc_3461 [Herbaspirillum seropedicae]
MRRDCSRFPISRATFWLCGKNGSRVRNLPSQIISSLKNSNQVTSLLLHRIIFWRHRKNIKRIQRLECLLWKSGKSDSPMSPLISRHMQQVGERLYMPMENTVTSSHHDSELQITSVPFY